MTHLGLDLAELGAIEPAGMSVALIVDEHDLANPRRTGAGATPSLLASDRLRVGAVQKLGVSRQGDALGLHFFLINQSVAGFSRTTE